MKIFKKKYFWCTFFFRTFLGIRILRIFFKDSVNYYENFRTQCRSGDKISPTVCTQIHQSYLWLNYIFFIFSFLGFFKKNEWSGTWLMHNTQAKTTMNFYIQIITSEIYVTVVYPLLWLISLLLFALKYEIIDDQVGNKLGWASTLTVRKHIKSFVRKVLKQGIFLKSSKHAPTYTVAQIRFHPLLVRWNQKPHFWYEDWNLPRIGEFTADELANEPNWKTTFTGTKRSKIDLLFFPPSILCVLIFFFLSAVDVWPQWVINYTDEYKFYLSFASLISIIAIRIYICFVLFFSACSFFITFYLNLLKCDQLYVT